MEKLIQFYESELGGKNFYQILKRKSNAEPKLFNPNLILPDIDLSKSIQYSEHPKVNSGDVRIDMPIFCGNESSKLKILILGLEPRHTDDIYNIMKIENRVFATPFGIDKWFSKSKQSVYSSSFDKFLKLDGLFLFSDFVKEYQVADLSQKRLNDQMARLNFEKHFSSKYRKILEQEIKIFEPSLIIGLGKTDIKKKVPKSWLNQFRINVISHPTNGNFNRMQLEMAALLR